MWHQSHMAVGLPKASWLACGRAGTSSRTGRQDQRPLHCPTGAPGQQSRYGPHTGTRHTPCPGIDCGPAQHAPCVTVNTEALEDRALKGLKTLLRMPELHCTIKKCSVPQASSQDELPAPAGIAAQGHSASLSSSLKWLGEIKEVREVGEAVSYPPQ